MNITLEKTGSSAVITVKMEKADYQDAVKKELKHIAAQVEIPGFRKGKAPFSFVEKRYGVQTKMEQVDKLLNASLVNYIEENKLEILGEPQCKVYPSVGNSYGSEKEHSGLHCSYACIFLGKWNTQL